MSKFSYVAAKEYCKQLVFIEKVRLNVSQFFTKMHQHFELDINQKMINQFISWCSSDNPFQIHHSVLCEYQIIADSSDMRDIIQKIRFEENEDYKIVSNGDSDHYYLSLNAFKIILATNATLMRTKYYFLLETIFGLYKEYQLIITYQTKSLSSAVSSLAHSSVASIISSNDDHVDLLYIIDHKLDNLARQTREDTNFLAKQIITLQKITNDLTLNIANIQSSAKYACKSLKCIIEQIEHF